MSTTNPRRKRPSLPPWLSSPPRVTLGRKDGKAVRITVLLTDAQRSALKRIHAVAAREHIQLSEPDVVRVAIDRLIADYEASQVEAEPEPEPEPEPLVAEVKR